MTGAGRVGRGRGWWQRAPWPCEFRGCNGGAHHAYVIAVGSEIFNTKGHKELLSGMYRSTKIFGDRVRTATAHSECARPRGTRISRDGQAAHRAVARRRDGDIAPYRNGAREVRTGGAHGNGARGVRTAKPHEACARAWETEKPHHEPRAVRAATGRGMPSRATGRTAMTRAHRPGG